MKSNGVSIWLSAAGAFLLVPGIAWLATSGMRLTDGDAATALQPLVRVDLSTLGTGPSSVVFTIPDTAQWTKIRKVWGPPDLLIFAAEPTRRRVLCLSEVPVRVELTGPAGKAVSAVPYGAPYGYSAYCQSSSLKFDAAPGEELRFRVDKTATTAPDGVLSVMPDWLYAKDHLVGMDLNRDTALLLALMASGGFLLLCSGMVHLATRRLDARVK